MLTLHYNYAWSYVNCCLNSRLQEITKPGDSPPGVSSLAAAGCFGKLLPDSNENSGLPGLQGLPLLYTGLPSVITWSATTVELWDNCLHFEVVKWGLYLGGSQSTASPRKNKRWTFRL